ncbi:unnamed protein product [Amoebophrya sp. A25]|nr:unnamed protein product [Amoebophrya sp. A25]|eukprot:GSA25T00014877001.1
MMKASLLSCFSRAVNLLRLNSREPSFLTRPRDHQVEEELPFPSTDLQHLPSTGLERHYGDSGLETDEQASCARVPITGRSHAEDPSATPVDVGGDDDERRTSVHLPKYASKNAERAQKTEKRLALLKQLKNKLSSRREFEKSLEGPGESEKAPRKCISVRSFSGAELLKAQCNDNGDVDLADIRNRLRRMWADGSDVQLMLMGPRCASSSEISSSSSSRPEHPPPSSQPHGNPSREQEFWIQAVRLPSPAYRFFETLRDTGDFDSTKPQVWESRVLWEALAGVRLSELAKIASEVFSEHQYSVTLGNVFKEDDDLHVAEEATRTAGIAGLEQQVVEDEENKVIDHGSDTTEDEEEENKQIKSLTTEEEEEQQERITCTNGEVVLVRNGEVTVPRNVTAMTAVEEEDDIIRGSPMDLAPQRRGRQEGVRGVFSQPLRRNSRPATEEASQSKFAPRKRRLRDPTSRRSSTPAVVEDVDQERLQVTVGSTSATTAATESRTRRGREDASTVVDNTTAAVERYHQGREEVEDQGRTMVQPAIFDAEEGDDDEIMVSLPEGSIWVNDDLFVDHLTLGTSSSAVLRYPKRQIVDFSAEEARILDGSRDHVRAAAHDATLINPGDEELAFFFLKKGAEGENHGRGSCRNSCRSRVLVSLTSTASGEGTRTSEAGLPLQHGQDDHECDSCLSHGRPQDYRDEHEHIPNRQNRRLFVGKNSAQEHGINRRSFGLRVTIFATPKLGMQVFRMRIHETFNLITDDHGGYVNVFDIPGSTVIDIRRKLLGRPILEEA